METKLNPTKIKLVYVGIFAMAIILVIFAARWHVVDAERLVRLGQSRYQESRIPALRGTIKASDGSTLAYSEPRYDLFMWYLDLKTAESKGLQTRQEFITKIAEIINDTPEQLEKKINSALNNQPPIYWLKLAESITVEQEKQIKSLTRDQDAEKDIEDRGKLVGYDLIYTYERIYPEGKLASQVIGLTNIVREDNKTVTKGLGGLEGEWDRFLEPIQGFESGELDARGNAVVAASEQTLEAKRGVSIYTSIDKRLQKRIEQRIKWGVEKFGAKSGSIVVMEPKTGRITAMANYPTFDPNKRDQKDISAYGNKAIGEPYEVGSVGKALTLAAAIDSGKVKPGDVIMNGHRGCEKLFKDLRPICTADKLPQPAMPISEAFRRSDNLYFIALAKKMDKKTFDSYLHKFGIGESTGIDLASESIGRLKPWQEWINSDVAAYSYGHSYQANLLQITNAYATLANHGVRMQPQIVTRVESTDGTFDEYKPTALERAVSKSTVRQMDKMMYEVYKSNIYWWEKSKYNELLRYKIAMKSGTALIPDGKGGYSKEINATYIGFDASKDRKFVMGVRLDSPKIGDLSKDNARIVWLETFGEVRDIIGVRRVN